MQICGLATAVALAGPNEDNSRPFSDRLPTYEIFFLTIKANLPFGGRFADVTEERYHSIVQSDGVASWNPRLPVRRLDG
jgi:hypothetical protein